MSTQTLLASATFAFFAAAIYAFIGHRLTRRALPKEGRLAAAGFVAFWYGLAVSSLLGASGVPALLGAFDVYSIPLLLILGQVTILALSVALWGLLYYLVYLYTGWRRAWIILAAFYAAFYLFLEYFVQQNDPIGITTTAWGVSVDYGRPQGPEALRDPQVIALIVGLLVPQIVASIAYFTLVFRVQSPTQRYRILLVSLSILVWFGMPFVGIFAGVSQTDGWQIFSRFVGLGAAIVIFLAYHPPGFVKRRFGIASLSDEAKPAADAYPVVPPPRDLSRATLN